MPKRGICKDETSPCRGPKVRHPLKKISHRRGRKTAGRSKNSTRSATFLCLPAKDLRRVHFFRHEDQVRDTDYLLSRKTHDWSRFLIQHSPNALITTDAQGRITEFNPAAERMTGYSQAEALGRPAEETLDCQGCDLSYFLNPVVGDQNEVTQEGTLRHRSGQAVPVIISYLSLWDERGAPQGGAAIIRDLSLVKRMETERRHLINMFAHDLKTPIVATSGLIRRLLQGKLGPLLETQVNYLETIDREMGSLERLVTRFLEFARLDLRILTPQPEILQVETECREVLMLLQPLAEAKEITLEDRYPASIPPLKADPMLFRRSLENLLENAIKYSPPRSRVALEVQVEDPAVRFAVRDQGPGIPPETLAHLFEIFYRGQGVEGVQGFGLGLAAVKRIVDAHGGRIWVDTAPGKGCTFFFTFPLSL
jgi:two-component system phosphate regulon sensor histidine kinase PhoR